jgi:hypothetical protein
VRNGKALPLSARCDRPSDFHDDDPIQSGHDGQRKKKPSWIENFFVRNFSKKFRHRHHHRDARSSDDMMIGR